MLPLPTTMLSVSALLPSITPPRSETRARSPPFTTTWLSVISRSAWMLAAPAAVRVMPSCIVSASRSTLSVTLLADPLPVSVSEPASTSTLRSPLIAIVPSEIERVDCR